MYGLVHHVAALNEMLFSFADTSCHGGTCTADGFPISTTPGDSVSFVTAWLSDLGAKPLTRSTISLGPPLFTICGLVESVTTLAFFSAFRTMTTSSSVNLTAKKC